MPIDYDAVPFVGQNKQVQYRAGTGDGSQANPWVLLDDVNLVVNNDRVSSSNPIPVSITGGTINATGEIGIQGIQTPEGDSMIDETNDALRVNVVAGSVGGAGGTSMADKNPFTTGTTSFTPVGGYTMYPGTQIVPVGTGGVLGLSPYRGVYTHVLDSGGSNVLKIDNSGNLQVTGSLTVIQTNTGQLAAQAHLYVSGNQVSTGNRIPVTLDNTTLTIQGTVDIGTLPTVSIGSAIPAGGNVVGGTRDAGPFWSQQQGRTGIPVFTSADISVSGVPITNWPDTGSKVKIDDILFSAKEMNMKITISEQDTANNVHIFYYKAAAGPVSITPRGGLLLPTANKYALIQSDVTGDVALTCLWHSANE